MKRDGSMASRWNMHIRRNESSPGRPSAEPPSAVAQVDVFMCLPADTVKGASLVDDVSFILPITSTIGQARQPQTITLSRATPSNTRQPSSTPMADMVAASMTPAMVDSGANAQNQANAGMGAPAAATMMPAAASMASNSRAASSMQQAGQVGAAVAPMEPMMIDPANGPFLGGTPTSTDDVLLTVIFLILFALGAFTHISIYRANAKRGHKFLLSDLVFDFCMVRAVTCIFRIIWAFFSPRGIILVALIFENGGAVVVFAVNLFFAQRIVRAMHPRIGWHPAFGYFSLFLIFSVPAIVVMNIAVISVSFFSVGKMARLQATEEALKFGASWNLMLSVMPLVLVFLAAAMPGPPPENFGSGELRCKSTVLVFSAVTLAVGAAVRLAALTNPEAGLAMSPLFSKAVFYATGFMLEILTVVAYAYFRVDLLFHIPNGASRPGDYSAGSGDKILGAQSWSAREIENEFARLGIRYERLRGSGGSQNNEFIAIFYPASNQPDMSGGLPGSRGTDFQYGDAELSPRNVTRVGRRQTIMESVRPPRPQRPTSETFYMTEKLPPSQFDD
ncbi:hypothetical protein HRG_004644 [Hirsutella rhossiliensis]|uniref:Uncharacterized protein n=1 Tax=Hirsutella rhossiliensis TaxID=111463 RepID=A0A9P8SIT2_9HYPO|nr:uncharacterized protein HRG_04644 [Hirsutella rhossiliensis]KAH0964216.1 hypothetical protein HRG_04644 [Hirsutella rhossiliensis]